MTDHDLIESIANGASIGALAKKLGAGKHAIYERLYKHGTGVKEIRSGVVAVRTINQVATLFGVHTDRVERWVRLGWLKHGATDKATRRIKRRYTLICDTAIMDFMALRVTWPSWEVEKITDVDWRREAMCVRSAGQWVRVTDILRARGYAPSGASKYVSEGWFPGAQLINGIWYVWRNA